MDKNKVKWIEKSIPTTASIRPPKKKERSLPQTPNTPPPSKGNNGGKK